MRLRGNNLMNLIARAGINLEAIEEGHGWIRLLESRQFCALVVDSTADGVVTDRIERVGV